MQRRRRHGLHVTDWQQWHERQGENCKLTIYRWIRSYFNHFVTFLATEPRRKFFPNISLDFTSFLGKIKFNKNRNILQGEITIWKYYLSRWRHTRRIGNKARSPRQENGQQGTQTKAGEWATRYVDQGRNFPQLQGSETITGHVDKPRQPWQLNYEHFIGIFARLFLNLL